MNLFNLAKNVNKKLGGNANDFIDFLIIIRKWLDKNHALSNELESNFVVNMANRKQDARLNSLNKSILNKTLHNKNTIKIKSVKNKPSCYEEIKNKLQNKYKININNIEKNVNERKLKMIELTVKMNIESTCINEAKEWLKELADNEMFEFNLIESKEL